MKKIPPYKYECVEFYPITGKNRFRGTLHIYNIDLQMDLRGIKCFQYKDTWHFILPFAHGKNQETGGKCNYPFMSFIDPIQHETLISFLKEEGKKFVVNRIKELKEESLNQQSEE